MKDSEFIELLNLYLDHEISAADAARLEAEVQNNPARRKVYEQYCRMQKACKMLSSDFVTAGEGAENGADRKVVPFNAAEAETASARRKRIGNLYTVGTFAAAAACVAIIFVGRNRQAADELVPQAAPIATTTVNEVKAPVVAGTPGMADVKPMLVSSTNTQSGPRPRGGVTHNVTLVADPLVLSGTAQADAVMAAAVEQARAQFAWIESIQLAPIPQPLPVSELRFEKTPSTLRPEGRALGTRAPVDANVEMTAIQFVK